jgi:hypothetical protein
MIPKLVVVFSVFEVKMGGHTGVHGGHESRGRGHKGKGDSNFHLYQKEIKVGRKKVSDIIPKILNKVQDELLKAASAVGHGPR